MICQHFTAGVTTLISGRYSAVGISRPPWRRPGPGSRILRSDNRNQCFAIEVLEIGLVGTANLVEIDWKNNHAFHGMVLGDVDVRGKGIGLDAIMAVKRYAFEELHLPRLDGSMIEYNSA